MKPIRLLLLFLCFCPLAVHAQTAEVGGAVQDPSGAVIPKASVEFRNQDTGVRRQTTTNGNGIYHIAGMDPGRYDATVQAQGFKTLTRENVTFQVGDKAQIDFKMQVGSNDQSVTVDGSGPNINTTDGSVGTVIDRAFVENTPLNGRSFQDLILLTPGVVTQSPQVSQTAGYSGDFSVNGQRTESNSYIVDGVSANTNAGYANFGANSSGSVPSSTALGTTQSLVSVDALQEFRVNSSTYSAEYGRTPGGQFSFVTRSGTDAFHGSVFDYLRNNYFDANNWFTDYYHTAAPALRQNDFGGTLGGPIRISKFYDGKKKSYFFVSYEGLRLAQPQPATLEYVPSLTLRQNPLLPAALKPILDAFPLPTAGGIDYGTGLAQFIQTDSLPSQIDSTSVRVDHAFSPDLRLFFRFSDAPSSTAARNLSIYEPTTSGNQTYTLGLTGQINANLSDDFRLGYANSNGHQQFTMDNFGGAHPINLANALLSGASPSASPEIILFIGGNLTALALSPGSGQMHQWNLTDAVSWLRGRNAIKVGIDYRHIESPITIANPSLEYEYTTEGQILSNAAAAAIAFVSLPKAIPTYNQFSAFVQDEWRLQKRLSLSLGLRWDVNPSPGSANGTLPYTLAGNVSDPASLTLAPKGTPLWKTTWYNIAPRLGAAWTINDAPGHETVFRAGGGVFFDTGEQVGTPGNGGVGFSAFKELTGAQAVAPFPGGIDFTPSTAPPYTSATVYAFYPHLQLPYTLEWSAALEQGFGQAQTVTISYVASNGRRLIQQNEASITSLNPNFGTILFFTNGPTSNYQSLQTKFQRSVRHGLQALVAYTWSHAFDYGSNFRTIPLQRGNADFDVRSNFTGGLTWQVPDFKDGRLASVFTNNWAIDGHVIARSGFPVNIQGNTVVDASTGIQYYTGVNLVPNQPLYIYNSRLPGGREINSAAFKLPSSGQTGNAPRNFVRGFGAAQLNLAARREFHIKDSLNLQFRAETFNILNHPTFGTITSTLGSTTFGQATKTLNQSLATVSSLYQMGGPRSMQFALKLQF